MKANNDTICFCLFEMVYFYNIKKKLFSGKFECKVGKINAINSIFYVFDYQIKKYYIFDTHGTLVREIDAKKFFCFDVTGEDDENLYSKLARFSDDSIKNKNNKFYSLKLAKK
jgi:hypothetical protein